MAWQLLSSASPGIVLGVASVGRPLTTGQMLAITGMVMVATALIFAAYIALMREFLKPDVSDRLSATAIALVGFILVLLLFLTITVESAIGGAAILIISAMPVLIGWISLLTRITPREHASPQRAWLLDSEWWPGAVVRVVLSGILRRSLLRTTRTLRSLKKELRDHEEAFIVRPSGYLKRQAGNEL